MPAQRIVQISISQWIMGVLIRKQGLANAALAFVTHVQLEEVDARLPGQDLAGYGLQNAKLIASGKERNSVCL